MKCLVGECKIEGSGEKCANGYAAYTDNKLDSVKGLSACLTLPVSHLLYAHLVMDKASKLAALQWEAETEKMSKRGWKKEKRVLLLTPSLKEPFTCVDTLEWLEGLSASWEKSWGEEEERNEKSNKSDWYSPPTVGQNARCNVNHDVPTVHPGPSWHYTTSCLSLRFGQSSHPEAQAQRLMFIQNQSTYFSYTTSKRNALTLVKPL